MRGAIARRATGLSAVLLALGASVAFSQDAKQADAQLMAWLRELEPLPKVHYSWPLPFDEMSDELFYEYARLTRAVSLSGEWRKPEHVDRAVAICNRVDTATAGTPVSIGVNFSIWHRRFGKELPPTDTGPTHQAELDYLKDRLSTLHAAVSDANQRYEANVAVTAILFDLIYSWKLGVEVNQP